MSHSDRGSANDEVSFADQLFHGVGIRKCRVEHAVKCLSLIEIERFAELEHYQAGLTMLFEDQGSLEGPRMVGRLVRFAIGVWETADGRSGNTIVTTGCK